MVLDVKNQPLVDSRTLTIAEHPHQRIRPAVHPSHRPFMSSVRARIIEQYSSYTPRILQSVLLIKSKRLFILVNELFTSYYYTQYKILASQI